MDAIVSDREPSVEREAVVARVDFGNCVLEEANGERHEAIVRGRMMGRTKSLGNAVVVGDTARFTIEGERAVISGIVPRKSSFSRRAAGERAVEQVVAANLDQVVLVASVVAPEFNPGFADRVLCQAEHFGLPARIALNKVDLAARDESEALAGDYARAGYPVHSVSAKSGQGVDAVREACRGLRSLFVGHSGVGKSTLLNVLAPGLELLEGRVNTKTGKGRHTTTAAWLLRPEPGLELIDTPGVRAFGLWGVGPKDLDRTYPEFRQHLGQCRFSDCRHDREPGCAVLAAAERGDIAARRLHSFVKLRAELEAEMSRA